MKINAHNRENTKKPQVYTVGGGIASLASAVYLIKDGHVPGENIHIFEGSDLLGGSLAARGSAETGYIMQGYRMFEEKIYSCTYDLLSRIPGSRSRSVKDEMMAFNRQIKTGSRSRLVEKGEVIDATRLGLDWKDRSDVFTLMARREASLGSRKIKDYFSASFFKSDFWIEFSTTFSFLPQHGLAELRRYFLRFIQESPHIDTLTGVRSTPYNQYDSIVVPIHAWLSEQGVDFRTNCRVTNVSFQKKKADRIYHTCNGKPGRITLHETDLVLVTLGSMIANSSVGSMTSAPAQTPNKNSDAWSLWGKMSKHHRGLGRPSLFTSHTDTSTLGSFTITSKDKTFFRLMEKLTGNKAGEQGLITFKSSNWLMSIVLPEQPHFIDQPKNITVCWGYGLYPDKKGNYVQKKMSQCTGEEILIELCSHLGFEKHISKIVRGSICLPCLMPYGTSQFLPRRKGDRPAVVPKETTNFACLGQYCEIPEDIVFTVEYSIRSAQIAVYSLLHLAKKVTPIYKGQNNIKVLYEAFKATLK